jgi:hypothetical protein
VELLITPTEARKQKKKDKLEKQGQDARNFSEGDDFTRT